MMFLIFTTKLEMRTTALLLCLFLTYITCGQNTIGLPEVINYGKQAYSGGNQNWAIKQDNNGIIYFGNNDGLLSFDGTFWHLYPLPNRTIIRAVEIGKDGRIYVGGQNELGYFMPDAAGRLQYHSLLYLIPKQERSFDDVWNICLYEDAVFFRSNRKIFQYSNNAMTVYTTTSEWRFMGVSNRKLIVQDLHKGILLYQNGMWTPFMQHASLPSAALITSFIPISRNRSLIATLKDGIYIYHQDNITPIS